MRRWLIYAAVALVVILGAVWLVHVLRRSPYPAPRLLWQAKFFPALGQSISLPPGHLTLVAPDRLLESGLFSVPKLYDLKGNLLWTFQPTHPNESGMVACAGPDGSIYVGTNKNYVYAIGPDMQPKWTFHAIGTKIWCCCPTTAPDGTIYVAASDEVLYALNPDGTQRWRAKIDGLSGRSPVVISPNGNIISFTRSLELTAISPQGQELWRTGRRGTGVFPPVFAADGRIFCVRGLDHGIAAYDATGLLLWDYSYKHSGGRPNGAGSFALASDGTLLVLGETQPGGPGVLFGLDRNGKSVFSYPIQSTMFTNLGLTTDERVFLFDQDYTPSSNPISEFFRSIGQMLAGLPKCRLTVLDTKGAEMARGKAPFFFPADAPIAMPDGSLLVLGQDGVLYCYK